MKSLRVVLATVGSRGDVQPMLAIAQALDGLGHVPVIAAPPNFESWVNSLGFEFAPLGADMQVYMQENRRVFSGNPLRMLRGMSSYFSEQIPLQIKQLVPLCQGADAIICAGLAVAAPSVAEHLRLPILGVLYTTCMLPSSKHPPPTVRWHGMPSWMNDLLWRANRLLGDKLLRGPLSAARAGIGRQSMRSDANSWKNVRSSSPPTKCCSRRMPRGKGATRTPTLSTSTTRPR